MKVRELIEELKKLPQDRTVICQVIPQQPSTGEHHAWNMEFSFRNVERSDWMVQLRVEHPSLKSLYSDGWDD